MSYSGKFKDKNNNLHPVTSVLYGTCDTAAATAAKVVTCTDFDTLMTGVTIRVKFDNANTAASPTVNINSTGAKSVYRFGSTAPVDGNSWNAGEVVELVYDGTSFFMTGADDIAAKQNATDNSLQTTDKTVVGAINEHEGDIGSLKSGLTTLDNEVNGDAVEYPYADVITIEDAVPANLAECNVKIEPVQDLHGYDKPWVGGAGKNKAEISNATLAGTIRTADISSGTVTLSGTTSESGYGPTVLWGQKLQEGTYILSAESFTGTGYIILKGWDYYANLDINGTTIVADGASTYRIAKYEASGADVDVTITGLMIRLSTETDATFAPYTNYCPITGHTEASVQRTGKNLINWNINAYYDYLETTLKQGTYTLSTKTATGQTQWYIKGIKPNGTFCTKSELALDSFLDASESGLYYGGYTLSALTFSVPVDNTVIRIGKLGTDGTIPAQLEIGTTATAFEPYAGQQYTLALGDTIYGGTVDFDSGVMTVDRAVVDLGTLTWTIGNQGQSTQHFYSNALSNYKYIDDTTVNFICENYESIPVSQRYKNGTVFINSAKNISIKDDNFNDATAFTTAMDGVQLVYELATPTTIQLTPQQIQLLKGTNTLTASTGQISVTVNGVSGSIGAVQEQVNGITRAIGWDDARNIFNGIIRQGYVSNTTGEYVDNASRWVCTTKQECKENTTYTVSASSSFLTRKIIVIYFDSNDTIISYSEFDHEASPVNINATITTPDNTAYIIVDIANQKNADGYNITPSDVWDVQIEEGTQVTPYIPYHPVIGTAVNKLLTKVPDAPTTDGTYSLQVTVTSGVPTYSWVSNA